MKHPSQSVLALFAGQDLGWFARWRTERHVAGCGACRQDVRAFTAVSETLLELNEVPPVVWNRLAAEMKANIRLGLAAGQCVRSEPAVIPLGWLSVPRALVAAASAMALLAAGLYLQRPAPQVAPPPAVYSAIVRATANGVDLEQGGQTLSLVHNRGGSVTYAAGAQGSLRAGYVDADGTVTINDVYVQ